MPNDRDNSYEFYNQCEYDREDMSLRRSGKVRATRFSCTLCGAGANVMENLCSPELNRKPPRDNT